MRNAFSILRTNKRMHSYYNRSNSKRPDLGRTKYASPNCPLCPNSTEDHDHIFTHCIAVKRINLIIEDQLRKLPNLISIPLWFSSNSPSPPLPKQLAVFPKPAGDRGFIPRTL